MSSLIFTFAFATAGCLDWLSAGPSGPYRTAPMAFAYRIVDPVSYVPYMSPAAARARAIRYDAGVWRYRDSGRLVSENGREQIYVMDALGEIYAGPRSEVIHHSSFLGGRPVAAAGTLFFLEDGRLEKLDTFSGHYFRGFRDPCESWKQTLREMNRRGQDIREVQIDEGRRTIHGNLQVGRRLYYVEDAEPLFRTCDDRSGLSQARPLMPALPKPVRVAEPMFAN